MLRESMGLPCSSLLTRQSRCFTIEAVYSPFPPAIPPPAHLCWCFMKKPFHRLGKGEAFHTPGCYLKPDAFQCSKASTDLAAFLLRNARRQVTSARQFPPGRAHKFRCRRTCSEWAAPPRDFFDRSTVSKIIPALVSKSPLCAAVATKPATNAELDDQLNTCHQPNKPVRVYTCICRPSKARRTLARARKRWCERACL